MCSWWSQSEIASGKGTRMQKITNIGHHSFWVPESHVSAAIHKSCGGVHCGNCSYSVPIKGHVKTLSWLNGWVADKHILVHIHTDYCTTHSAHYKDQEYLKQYARKEIITWCDNYGRWHALHKDNLSSTHTVQYISLLYLSKLAATEAMNLHTLFTHKGQRPGEDVHEVR